MKYASKNRGMPRKKNWIPYAFVFPAFLAMLLVHFIPSLIGIGISFTDFSAMALRDWGKASFVGLRNYLDIFSNGVSSGAQFLESLQASAIYTVSCLALIYCIGLIAALTLNKETRLFKILRGIFLLGWVIPSVVSGFAWKTIFFSESGPLNAILMYFRIIDKPIYWLIGPLAICPPIVANVWKSWPFAFVTLLAGLQSIPKEMYDAAEVDGANWLQRFFYVTLPSLFPITRVLIMLLMIWTALDFSTVYIMYGYAPPPSANVLPVFVYNMGYQAWDFGRASAVSVVLMLAMLVICIFYVRHYISDKNNP